MNRIMLRLSYIAVFALLISGIGTVQAQQVSFDAMHETDGAIYLKNVDGNEIPHNANGNAIEAHPVFRVNISERIERGLSVAVRPNGNINGQRDDGPTFHLTYLDQVNSTNIGFDDPTLGQQRRNALEAAFEYYASIIQNPGSADIEIRESFSANPNTNPFGFSAAYYFGSKGFNSPFTKSHLISGSDPYGAYPDGYIQFNFHSAFNYSYSVSGYPNDQQFDFYTIAIHEIMHLLGFTSYADQTGASAASENVYTTFDQLLFDYNKNELFEASGSGSSTVVKPPEAGSLTNAQVWFELDPSQYAPVFSPHPFTASSLDHFDNNRTAHGQYVMHPLLSRGDGFKLLHEDEVRVLEKLGYDVNYSIATSIADDPQADGPLQVSSLYPNPAHSADRIQINIGDVKDAEILIIAYDVMGRQAYSKVILNKGPGPVTAIDPYNNLSPGMYIVVGSTKDELFNQKLVIK